MTRNCHSIPQPHPVAMPLLVTILKIVNMLIRIPYKGVFADLRNFVVKKFCIVR